MALYWGYTCNDGRGEATVVMGTSRYPTCAQGQGSWIQMEIPATTDTCCTVEQYAAIGINAEDVFYAFSWGFGAVLLFWSLGYAAAAAIEAIKQL